MHVFELQAAIEDRVRSTVERHFPLDWKEDAITHDLLIRLRSDFQHVTLRGTRSSVRLEWEAYKLHGWRETSHGDVGVLVRYRLPNGDTVEGAGFLEAKVRGRDTTRFLQVRHEQVTRLLARSPLTRLMLYDYNPVTVIDSGLWSEEYFDGPWHPRWRRLAGSQTVSSAPVLPLQLAATINQYDDTLYRFAHSFSHQLCQRYFCLHDLDFSDGAVKAVKGFPTELGTPSVILVVRLASGNQELPESFTPTQNTYGTLE